jgi:hypothetical protein
MVVESTQERKGTGKPATPVAGPGIPEDDLSAGEPSLKEVMRLEDGEPAAFRRAAAPPPPGETEPPPPDKGVRATGSNDVKSPAVEAKPSQTPQPPSNSAPSSGPATQPQANKPPASPPRPVSQAKVKLQEGLPALADDADIGQEKEQTVPRDGKADLGFTGKLLGSAASSAPKGMWQELRVYSTTSGKHVFSRVTRTIFADENDKHEADVFEPSPTSVPSQLLRSARDMTRSRPLTWMDAAVAFFGYDPLAKVLYRKLSVDFEERI